MVNRSCTTCVYAYWDPGQWLASLSTGFVSRPLCANHPDAPGLMKPVPFAGPCRNYRPKPPEPDKDAKRIPLGDGLYAYVDAADFEWLSQYNWRLQNGYAARRDKTKTTYMHNEIMKPAKGMMVDHLNHNKLDNCRVNLRTCTRQQNTQNNRKHMGTSSQFKGVGYSRDRHKWFSKIWFEGQRIWLGYFTEEVEAAHAYDRKAVELFGEFAYLNFPEEWSPERRKEVHAQHQEAGKEEGAKNTLPGSRNNQKMAARRKTKPARVMTPEPPQGSRERAKP